MDTKCLNEFIETLEYGISQKFNIPIEVLKTYRNLIEELCSIKECIIQEEREEAKTKLHEYYSLIKKN